MSDERRHYSVKMSHTADGRHTTLCACGETIIGLDAWDEHKREDR